jgi:hypothetical protein
MVRARTLIWSEWGVLEWQSWNVSLTEYASQIERRSGGASIGLFGLDEGESLAVQ